MRVPLRGASLLHVSVVARKDFQELSEIFGEFSEQKCVQCLQRPLDAVESHTLKLEFIKYL